MVEWRQFCFLPFLWGVGLFWFGFNRWDVLVDARSLLVQCRWPPIRWDSKTFPENMNP